MACAEAGASSYLTRDASIEDVVAAIHGVAQGEESPTRRIVVNLMSRLGQLAGERTAVLILERPIERLGVTRRAEIAHRLAMRRRANESAVTVPD